MKTYDGLIIDRADGCWLTDVEGKRYLDGGSSLWCNIHGHNHPKINRAIQDQLSKVAHVTSLGMSHPTAIQLAERLISLAPKSLQHVFYCSDGASAVEVAMKIAFQYWQQCDSPQPKKTKFVALGKAYHGDTIGTVALGGVELFHSLFKPLLFPVLRGPSPQGQRNGNLAKRASSSGCLVEQEIEQYITSYRCLLEENGSEVAAVVVEPLLQCSAGMVFHPPGFLRRMGELCREFDTLLIVDEIAVGMGRTGKLFASEHEGVEPDLLCIGKGLTGGYLPMSATLTSARIFEAFLGGADKTLYHGHTYGGNPLAAAASLATLELTEELLQGRHWEGRTKELENGLKKLLEYDDVVRADQLGLLGTIELREGSELAASVCRRALERGVWLRPLGNCIPIVPPLSIEAGELELLLSSLEYGLDPTVKVL